MLVTVECDFSHCHIKYVRVYNGLPLTNIYVLSTLTYLADNLATVMCRLSRNSVSLNLMQP
jgi:hypothetical protein